MEYTVGALARLAGVSIRTLRHYDEQGLLAPCRISSAGYRIYSEKEISRLQQILFFRELGLSLGDIARVMEDAAFDRLSVLHGHLTALEAEKCRIASLIDNVKKTILAEEGTYIMSDQERFEGFKKQLVEENEAKYGAEVREKYGDKTIDESNRKMMNMSEAQYEAMQETGRALQALIEAAVKGGAAATGEQGRETAALHKKWLLNTWPQYSAEAHKGLAQMYVDDERFTAYYDGAVKGCAAFLRDAICAWAEEMV